MIIIRAILGTDVILTGFLEETLEGLAEMVIIAISSHRTVGIKVFSNTLEDRYKSRTGIFKETFFKPTVEKQTNHFENTPRKPWKDWRKWL